MSGPTGNPWLDGNMPRGDAYQARFDEAAARGDDVHGEVALLLGLDPRPASVLDAGCGTGRLAVELDRRGLEVVGVDLDPANLVTARRLAPHLRWVEADLAGFDLGRTFDVVVLAGNVLVFVTPGTEAAVVAGCAAHVAPGGSLVAGFQLGRGYGLDRLDADAAAAGLHLAERWSTWDRRPWDGGSYAVSHFRTSPASE